MSEAVDAFARHDGATYAAGCTDLVAKLREGLRPQHVVSLRFVEQLRELRRDGDDLVIGAAVDHYRGSRDPLVVAAVPGLAQGWSDIATVRVRRRATIGGNVMAARPRYEMSVQLDALGAGLEFATAAGAVVVPCADIWAGTLPNGSLLTSVRVPTSSRLRYVYDRSLRPTMGIAAALRDNSRLRIAVGTEYHSPAAAEIDGADRATTAAEVTELLQEVVGRLPDHGSDAAASSAYRHRAVVARLRALWPSLRGEES